MLFQSAIGALVYGPGWAALAGGMEDFIGAMLFPVGPYFPGFTLTAGLTGLVFGLLLYGAKREVAGVCGAACINSLVLSLVLNSVWISVLYDSSFVAILPTRLVQCAVMIPVQIAVLLIIKQPVKRLFPVKA